MDGCRGVHDWLECIRCNHICSSRCPFEGNEADVLVELSARLNAAAEKPAQGSGLAVERTTGRN